MGGYGTMDPEVPVSSLIDISAEREWKLEDTQEESEDHCPAENRNANKRGIKQQNFRRGDSTVLAEGAALNVEHSIQESSGVHNTGNNHSFSGKMKSNPSLTRYHWILDAFILFYFDVTHIISSIITTISSSELRSG